MAKTQTEAERLGTVIHDLEEQKAALQARRADLAARAEQVRSGAARIDLATVERDAGAALAVDAALEGVGVQIETTRSELTRARRAENEAAVLALRPEQKRRYLDALAALRTAHEALQELDKTTLTIASLGGAGRVGFYDLPKRIEHAVTQHSRHSPLDNYVDWGD